MGKPYPYDAQQHAAAHYSRYEYGTTSAVYSTPTVHHMQHAPIASKGALKAYPQGEDGTAPTNVTGVPSKMEPHTVQKSAGVPLAKPAPRGRPPKQMQRPSGKLQPISCTPPASVTVRNPPVTSLPFANQMPSLTPSNSSAIFPPNHSNYIFVTMPPGMCGKSWLRT